MSESIAARLGSAHLEDLAVVAVMANIVSPPPAYPVLADAARSKLRARLKQFSRFDWPASSKEDPLLRRGYTLQQCCRLVVALLLTDAGFPPSEVVPIARSNELGFLRAMTPAMNRVGGKSSLQPAGDDPIALVLRGDLTTMIAPATWEALEPQRVRFVKRSKPDDRWSGEPRRIAPGTFAEIDVTTAAAAVWYWLSDRDLLPEDALSDLIECVVSRKAEPDFAMT